MAQTESPEDRMIGCVRTLLNVFAGKLPLRAIEDVMSEDVVHKNFLITDDGKQYFEEKRGIQEWKTWAIILRKAVTNLGVAEEEFFVRGNQVFAVFRWTADSWHPSIEGKPKYSNFVYAKYTIQGGKITVTETCRQNYIFMFGTNFSESHLAMHYKKLLGFPIKDKPQTVISGILPVTRFAGQQALKQALASFAGGTAEFDTTALFVVSSREVHGLDLPNLQATELGDGSLFKALLRAVKLLESGRSQQVMLLAVDAVTQDQITLAGLLLQPLSEARTVHALIQGLAFAQAPQHKREAAHTQILEALYGKKQIAPQSIEALYASDALTQTYRKAFGDKAPALKLHTYGDTANTATTAVSAIHKAIGALKRKARVAFDQASPQGAIGHLILDRHATAEPQQIEVAIIGMAGVMPGSKTPEGFWQNLAEGKELLSDITKQRAKGQWPDDKPIYAGLLQDVDKFDAAFFQVSPKEAELMDPQQRLILQVVWQAIEHSANALSDFANKRTAVFIGASNQDYKQLFTDANGKVDALNYTSLESSMLANRIARLLNSAGPCQTINTECATTLVALHTAANLIKTGAVDRAVVGAVNVLLHPYSFAVRSKNGLLADDQQALPFDQDSQGYLRGEGAGAFVLKRFDQAEADGDNILAILKGSAVNQSQHALSLTAPHVASQAKALTDAWQAAEIDPSTISYIETHANGYVEGDMVEVSVLKKAFSEAGGQSRTSEAQKTCALTSVKSAIGHLEAASGVSMLLKVLQAFKHKQILGIKGLRKLHPRVDFNGTPFEVCQQTRPWHSLKDAQGQPIPRRAGINAFGVGGTNAHIVLEEYRSEPNPVALTPKPVLITLSAKTEDRLKQIAADLNQFVQHDALSDADLPSLAFTLQTGRLAMRERLAFSVATIADLRQKLQAFTQGQPAQHRGLAPANPDQADPQTIETALQQADLSQLAQLWLKGATLDWTRLYGDTSVRRLALPTYPFEGQSYWLPGLDKPQVYENKAVAFYSFWAGESGTDYQEEYLTFCPFPEKIPGFSLTRIFLNPTQYKEEMDFVREKQIEMRQVLFYKEDYGNMQAMLDFGCGHGTDVIQFAKRYPNLRTHGFTITKDQAELGNKRIGENGLNGRAQIFHKNSAEDPFPSIYDLIIGVEVSFHIRNKDGLFGNIASSLKPGGRVLLMDFTANLRGAIVDPNVEISIPTHSEWVELLSRHGLVIDELIDVSPEVANFLYDPDFEQYIQGKPKVVRDTYTNYVHQSHALNKGWISYCLIKLQKNDALSLEQRKQLNRAKLASPIPYADALQEMLHPGSVVRREVAVAKPTIAEPQVQQATYSDVDDVKSELQAIFARVLKYDHATVTAAVTFTELGVTSITAVELLEQINGAFDLNLPTSLIFEFNNFDDLAPAVFAAAPKRRQEPQPAASQPQATPQAPSTNHDIAVIGLACRSAGAQDQQQFWELIRSGKDCIQEIENPEWLDFFKTQSRKPVPTRYGRMHDTQYFDPLFFNMSPLEAATIDPAQRLVLEETYKALEDAGYAPSNLRDQSVGTFIGSMGGMSENHDDSHFAMLGAETSILAARPAYFLNLKGPALAVNTACSSSLVAMDLACQQLQHGDVDMAIAGGVTLYNTPEIFVRMNNAGMLSPTGECRPFDKAANGVVVGDGIGIVVLKRLADAERDGDRIYGVIRGSGTNQDGQTTGITVPSFLSQSQLESAVYRKHQIPVEDIQYLEAHGTATKLGDPIEIHALQDSFKKFTEKRGYCAIGSLKGNIGHTTAASGVLSVIKVLLSMQHGQLPPSINYREGNEHIDFEASPFYVNTALKDWPRHEHGPRLAAVSSFGFSGTNAHMVLQEYADTRPAHHDMPVALPLSAKTPEQLRQQAQNLLHFVQGKPDVNLADLAYTLQVGRDALPYRLGIVAETCDALIDKLQAFLAGQHDAVYSGKAQGKITETAHDWIAKRNYPALLMHWVQGLKVDWQQLYPDHKPRRISAPTYPFAREAQTPPRKPAKAAAPTGHLHPLVQQNTADFFEQRYTSTFNGSEFFLADHQVQGKPVLPGVAYLEMALTAASKASGHAVESLHLKHVHWLQPLTITQPKQVHIGLVLQANQQIDYQIYTIAEADSETRSIHSQGALVISAMSEPAPSLPLQQLRNEMNRGSMSADQAYAAFDALGLQYGPAHQGIAEILLGDNQVLAKLILPSNVQATQDDYILHPSLFDSSLQAIVALLDREQVSTASLPFALDELRIWRELPATLWAWIRPDSSSAETTYDVDLCDAQGQLCAQLKSFTVRALSNSADSGLLHLSPIWQQVTPETASVPAPDLIIGGTPAQQAAVKKQFTTITCLSHDEAAEPSAISSASQHLVWIADASDQPATALFRIIKKLLANDAASKPLHWTIITNQTRALSKHEAVQHTHAALHGLAGSMAKEYPHWQVRVFDMQADSAWPVAQIFALQSQDLLVHRNGQWFQQSLAPLQVPSLDHPPYKTHGCYVVIGGAGGIGAAWSEHVIKNYQARVFWIGRRPLNAEIQTKLDQLAQLGPAPTYIQADATDLASLAAAYQTIKQQAGQIHGVIHAAIALLDASLANMDEARFQAGLAAKADVCRNLAQVFEHQELDFALFFSSLQSFLKLPGQSNYAAGCTFKDAFAEALGREWTCRVKVINWGYWGNVGVVANAAQRERMRDAGIGSIEPAEAMAAIETLLTGPLDQIALVKTLKPDALPIISKAETTALLPARTPSLLAKLNPAPSASQLPAERPQQAVEALVLQILAASLEQVGEPIPLYTRWFEASRDMLKDTVSEPLDRLWQKWQQAKPAWQQSMGEWLQLLEPCLRNLPQILSGQTKATDVIFPHASLKLVEGIYHGNAVADYYNAVLADTVVNYIQARLAHDPNAQIRLFEIGAGTGGTTAGLIERLKPFEAHIAEYRYTDLSQAFLLHAREAYAAPYLTTQIFNVEKPLADQDLQNGSYDLVIASNVLHATVNMRNTVRNAKALLCRNGLLVLNEMTFNTPLHHLTFGLLKGWWLYDDTPLRLPGCPGLATATWQRLLQQEGFADVAFPAENGHHLSQQIIVAESDGVVRQARTQAATNPVSKASVPTPKPAVTTASAPSQQALREQATNWVKKLVADTLKLAPQRIDASRPLEDYGIDSILVVQLTELLRRHFDHISSTLFFEVQTIDALVEHLLETQQPALVRLLDFTAPQSQQVAASPRQVAQARLPRIAATAPAPNSGIRDVAVIGLSGRYPEAEDMQQFWQNLKASKNCITEIPQDRWDWRAWFDEQRGKPGFSYSRWGGFIKDVDAFDPLFFHISPRDAEQMDPQERLFLQTAYASIQDAGYTPQTLAPSRKVGVFVGVMNSAYGFTPNYASIANRVSYTMDFQGPSLAVDTACSSSLTAIHLALESIYSGTSHCAIAGGVNLILHPGHYQSLSELTMLSASDQCKSFGAGADGFVDGEGVGAVVLKPLEQAIEDSDQIYGVLKASMLNSGGKTNGYTVPNPKAQAALIQDALQRAQVPASTIGYIEAHGTGTVLGDPIEVSGLTQAFAKDDAERGTKRSAPCALGSIKSNIGHTESAAGIAGLTKVLLQLKHGQLVPSLHAATPNPNIDFANTPFRVQQQTATWPRLTHNGRQLPRRAGLSSFGAGGANAHLIIEEHQSQPTTPAAATPVVIVLSAKSADRLKAVVQDLHAHISDSNRFGGPNALENLAYTLQVGREALSHRLGLIVTSTSQLIERLTQWLDGEQAIEDAYQGQLDADNLAAFSNDDALQEAVAKWIERKQFSKLLEFWIKGFAIDWQQLYVDQKPQRISLPTYPFLKQRYWKPDTRKHEPPKPPSQPQATTKQWLAFKQTWRAQPLAEQVDFYARLQHYADKRVYLIYRDEAHKQAFQTLLQQLQTISKMPQQPQLECVHIDAINFTAQTPAPDVVLILSATKDSNDVRSLFQLSQSCMTHYPTQRIDFFYLYAAPSTDHAALSGLLQSAMQENPAHTWHSIARSDDTAAPAHQLLLSEWLAREPHAAASFVRYQQAQRQTLGFAEITLDTHRTPLRTNATYLISGGLGPLGEQLCCELAKRYQATLVILSRASLDQTKRQQCERIDKLGAKVHYYAVDISDRLALQQTMTCIKQDVGDIHGVIHLARLVEDAPIVDKDWSSFERVIAAKVSGTCNLDELTAHEPLDCFVLFSSLAAFGIRGSADYGYATAFQNAFAEQRQALVAQGKRAGTSVSLCWGPWTVDRYVPQNRDQRMRDAGFDLIDMQLDWPQIEASFASDQPILGLMAASEPHKLRQRFGLVETSAIQPSPQLRSLLDTLEQQQREGQAVSITTITDVIDFEQMNHLDPTTINRIYALLFPEEHKPAPDKPQSLADVVRETVLQVLKLDQIGDHQSFQDCGMDSIAATQISLHLERKLKRSIQPQWFVDFSTVHALTQFLTNEQAQTSS